jgi:hypothetical protein
MALHPRRYNLNIHYCEENHQISYSWINLKKKIFCLFTCGITVLLWYCLMCNDWWFSLW